MNAMTYTMITLCQVSRSMPKNLMLGSGPNVKKALNAPSSSKNSK